MKQIARKLIDLRTRLWLNLFRLLTKIHANRVILWSTRGNQYSCNPKYIAEYLCEKEPNRYDIIFAFTPKCMRMQVPPAIRKVKIYDWSRRLPGIVFMYYLSTSKFIITNFRTRGGDGMIGKRKDQFFIQTYHGGWGAKPIELDYNFTDRARVVARRENSITDLMLSTCPDRTLEIRRAQMYEGEILEAGSPRDDIFFDSQRIAIARNKVFAHYKLPANAKVVLYAPTFRDRDTQHLDIYRLNWEKILNAFKQRFGGDFYVLLRLHSHIARLSSGVSDIINDPHAVNATLYSDMQELLAASDYLITDYSSSPFDYIYTGRPCFLYCPDYEDYISFDRTELKFDIKCLPFPYTESEQELCDIVSNFDLDAYQKSLSAYLHNMNSFETGHACEALAAWMKAEK